MPKIIDKLDEFADKLVAFITTDSEKGQERLVNVFATVKKKYGNEEYAVWGWFYQFSRTRGPEIEKTMLNLKSFPDPLIRLQEFQQFFGRNGNWKSTSANTELFLLLINSIPGYDKEEDAFLHATIIPRLKDLLVIKIQRLVTERALSERQKAEEKKELESIHRKKSKEVVFIYNNAENARLFAIDHPENLAFYLNVTDFDANNLKWELTWYDMAGTPSSLLIEPELAGVLKLIESELKNLVKVRPALGSENAASQVEAKQKLLQELFTKSASAGLIKAECKRILETGVLKQQVLFNPDPSSLTGLVSTFVIKKEAQSTLLYWYDSLGKENQLSLAPYPKFALWINQKTKLSNDDFLQLKAYLRQVNIRKEVDVSKKRTVESALQMQLGVKNPVCIAMNQYPPVTEIRPKPGSFIITKNENWQLYYIDTLEKVIKVDMETCPETTRALLGKLQENPEGLSALKMHQLARTLVDFTPASRLDLAKFSELKEVLDRRFQSKPEIASTANSDEDKKPVSTEGESSISVSNEEKPSSSPQKPGKLDIGKYAAISGLFGQKSAILGQQEEKLPETPEPVSI